MNRYLMLASLPAILATPAPAKEKPPVFVEAKHVKDAPVVTLDPTKAYVLLRTSGVMPVSFTRVLTAEDQAAYDKLTAAALVEAQEDHVKKLKRYESAVAAAARTPGVKVPEKPIEPTQANFQFTPFARLANFGIGPFNRFANKGGSVYLHAVTPGTYRLYGQNDPILGGGVCYCMGSVNFEAVAGRITDLGTLSVETSGVEPPAKGDSSSPRMFAFAFTLVPADAAVAIDPRLASLSRAPAVYRAGGKAANYWGIGISRLPAIASVFTYERDRMVEIASVTP